MILTGKALQDFIKWVYKEYKMHLYNVLNDTCMNAFIIEFFDSERYTIDRNAYCTEMAITDWNTEEQKQYVINCDFLDPFKEWWDAAIEKANYIYNGI